MKIAAFCVDKIAAGTLTKQLTILARSCFMSRPGSHFPNAKQFF
jgi:hypothetical protein